MGYPAEQIPSMVLRLKEHVAKKEKELEENKALMMSACENKLHSLQLTCQNNYDRLAIEIGHLKDEIFKLDSSRFPACLAVFYIDTLPLLCQKREGHGDFHEHRISRTYTVQVKERETVEDLQKPVHNEVVIRWKHDEKVYKYRFDNI